MSKLRTTWRKGSRWQTTQVGHREIRDIANGSRGICARLEVNLDETDAAHRAGFDVVDVAAQSEEAFITIRDVGLNLLGRHTGVERSDHNDRNLDRWKQIHWHIRDRGNSHDDGNKANHQDEKRITDRKGGHKLLGALLVIRKIVGSKLRLYLFANLKRRKPPDDDPVSWLKSRSDLLRVSAGNS